MCHGKLRHWEDRAAKEERRERLWDLFDRETRDPAPPAPIVEAEERPDLEREEVMTGAGRPAHDEH